MIYLEIEKYFFVAENSSRRRGERNEQTGGRTERERGSEFRTTRKGTLTERSSSYKIILAHKERYIMKKVVVFALFVVVIISLIDSISSVRYSFSESENEQSRRADNNRNGNNALRSKRRLQDVEKLMIEDEVLSYLICDVCEKHTCDPKYCRFCSQCMLKFNGKLSIIVEIILFLISF